MQEIQVSPLDATRFDSVLEPSQANRFATSLATSRLKLNGHTFWHINSTAAGGGVAEMLQSVLCYLQGGGISTRWAVIEGDENFFLTTKRIHHFLHGSGGDGGQLGEAERASYVSTLEREAATLATLVQPGDVVVLHDPQTLGFAPILRKLGTKIIWSCHVGADEPNQFARRAWEFLSPYTSLADRIVFSRRRYTWDQLDPEIVEIIPPCIDAFSPKNQHLPSATVAAILDRAGIVPNESPAPTTFHRQDGGLAAVRSNAEMVEEACIPADAKIATQISRWDPLKDHLGVMLGFCKYVPYDLGAHLLLAGPSPDSVTDDPEGAQTLDELRHQWTHLSDHWRRRVHLACIPMDDLEENAVVVNALQRRSNVIIQKSLAEGFGLTVAEAMWKETPTVASAVGGIQDQIEDGVNGLLIDDPLDLVAFGQRVADIVNTPDLALQLGQRAHGTVRNRYLAPPYLTRFLDLAVTIS